MATNSVTNSTDLSHMPHGAGEDLSIFSLCEKTKGDDRFLRCLEYYIKFMTALKYKSEPSISISNSTFAVTNTYTNTHDLRYDVLLEDDNIYVNVDPYDIGSGEECDF